MKLMLQEIQVWYIIPAIRAEMVRTFLDKGLKQRQVAEILGVTEAAVSQYKKQKRAKSVTFDEGTKKEIYGSVETLMQNKSCAINEIQRILDLVKDKHTLCDMHKRYNDECAKCSRVL